MNNLGIIAEQRKNQRAEKIKNRFLKQTHVVQLAEILIPLKKLTEVNDSIKKLTGALKTTDSENEKKSSNSPLKINLELEDEDHFQAHLGDLPNSSNFSYLMNQTLGMLMASRNSSKTKNQDDSARTNIFGVPIPILGGDKIKIRENTYEITPEK